MNNRKGLMRISINSPVILVFTLICFIALILSYITNGAVNSLLFSVYRSSLFNPLTYVRLVGHIFGHADWSHFIGNITLILIIGPLLEEKYGSSNMVFIILVTALITGILNFILFPDTMLLGASGVVFTFIILSSFTNMSNGRIPLTFILVAIIYLGGQIYDGIFVKDNISNFVHIVGGIIGAGFGYVMYKK